MNTISNKHEQLWESLRDPEFRKQLIDEHINVGIALQIRALRERQELTQAKLAELLGVKQPLISEWENPNYGKYTLGTLKDMARAFDVGLLVRFVPFSTLVDWTINLTSDIIAPPSFNEEERYHVPISASAISNSLEGTIDVDAYDIRFLLNKSVPSTATTTRNERELANVA